MDDDSELITAQRTTSEAVNADLDISVSSLERTGYIGRGEEYQWWNLTAFTSL